MKEIKPYTGVSEKDIKDAIDLVLELRNLKNIEFKEIKKYKPRSKDFIK